ncbi:phage-related tail component, partial [Lacticaseibacillus paracasei subsp. paracasei Lpp41]
AHSVATKTFNNTPYKDVPVNLLTGNGYHTVTGSLTQGYLSNETTNDLLTLFKGLEGQTVTVSVDYEYSGFIAGSGFNRIGWETQITADTATYSGPWYYPNNDSGTGRISSTFVVPKNITSVYESMGFIQFSGSGTGTLSHLKLEKGSVATPWSPNPSDPEYYADTITVHNGGTYPVEPVITATMHADNGMVGIVNDRPGILQF